MRILHVYKYLQDQTDEDHPTTIRQILDHLASKNITAHRRTIAGDIVALLDFGVDIITVKSTQNLYFIGQRHFELPEVQLLIDAVLSAKSITSQKSRVLVKKLGELVSEHQRSKFAEENHIADRVKPQNENVYRITDTLQTAIGQKKRVSFQYFELSVNKRKTLKHKGYHYIFSPYFLLWNEDKYYVIGHSEKHGKIVTFRIDRIHEATLTDKDAISCPDAFDLSAFCQQVFGMYDGERATVELKCRHCQMKAIVDKFGEDVHTEPLDEEWFFAKVDVFISPTFYGWLLGFTDEIILTAPDTNVQEYRKILGKAIENL